MGEIRDRMVADLTLRGAAQKTCEAYLRCAHAFVAFHRRSPIELGTEHVRAWLLHLLQEKRRSPRTVNVAIAALRVLFEVTLGRPEVDGHRSHRPRPASPARRAQWQAGRDVPAAHAESEAPRHVHAPLRYRAAHLGAAGVAARGHRQPAHGRARARHL